MAMLNRPIVIASGTTDALDSTGEVVIPVGNDTVGRRIVLHEVALMLVSGSATTSAPRVCTDTGVTAADVRCMYSKTATAVATLIDDRDILSIRSVQSSGNLYLTPGPDAASDNIYNYVIAYEVLS